MTVIQLISSQCYNRAPVIRRSLISIPSLAGSHGTLVLCRVGECFAKLNMHSHEVAVSRDPAEPAALASGLRADCARSRENQSRSAHAALHPFGPRDFAAGCSAQSCD